MTPPETVLPEASEYVPHPLDFSNDGNDWTIHLEVNESANDDHQLVRIWLKGTDLAGFDIGPSSAADGTLWWGKPHTSKRTVIEPRSLGQWQCRESDQARTNQGIWMAPRSV